MQVLIIYCAAFFNRCHTRLIVQWCFCDAHVQVIRQKGIRANKPFSGSAFALAPLGSNALN